MTPEEFRKAGHQLIDWIADYRSSIEQMPVRAQVKPGEVKNSFERSAPDNSAPFGKLIDLLDARVIKGITQVQSPMHFGWFPSNASLASVLGDIASSGLGALGISWESCPSLTEVEEVTINWMRQLVGLSDKWRGTIHDTASTACLTALMAARERTGEFSLQHGGLQALANALVVYTTEEAHSSVEKSALLAGFGRDNLRRALRRRLRNSLLIIKASTWEINRSPPHSLGLPLPPEYWSTRSGAYGLLDQTANPNHP